MIEVDEELTTVDEIRNHIYHIMDELVEVMTESGSTLEYLGMITAASAPDWNESTIEN